MIYEPVYTDVRDSAHTLEQIDRNNAVWLLLCDDAKYDNFSLG